MKKILFAAGLIGTFAVTTQAAVVITEVYPSGSGNATYASDWFELTNTGSTPVDITGWAVDDSSNAYATALVFRGVGIIPAGGTVILIEGNTSGSNDATKKADFITDWFGGTAPAGFLIGSYGGSGIGLSTGGDEVNVFNAAGSWVTGVSFGATSAGFTLDNTIGATGAISTYSSVGVNGAFTSTSGEVGSPGVTAAVPEPASLGLIGAAGLMALRRRRAM